MSIKKFDIEKMIAKKVTGQMKAGGASSRFGQGAGEVLDKRERRARDSAAGLVSFACKLPGELIKQLHERAATHEGGINAVTAELLAQALAQVATPAEPGTAKTAAKPAAKKKAPAAKKAAAE